MNENSVELSVSIHNVTGETRLEILTSDGVLVLPGMDWGLVMRMGFGFIQASKESARISGLDRDRYVAEFLNLAREMGVDKLDDSDREHVRKFLGREEGE